jgi:DNA polymerase III subunit epsilon
MRFIALDVETANPDLSSICQIGLVVFENGSPIDTWSVLVNPEDWFDEMNTSIHGISEHSVESAPNFKSIAPELARRIAGEVVVIHTAFDRNALAKASTRHGITMPECLWLDTARVARRAWPEVSQRGYGLGPLAEKFGIEFKHHDAAEDARAAGLVLVRAIADTGLDVANWLQRITRPINQLTTERIAIDGNPEGALYGEIVVFTGALQISRREAADMAALLGCNVASVVNKHTTLLIVGDQDIFKLNGHDKSSKHRKAEELMAKGESIRILSESDFMIMVKL